MLRIGLTGGIGAGKSTVAARFAELGAVIIDADQLAREVVAPGTEGLAEVVATFGPQFLRVDGTLDRRRLAEVVFGDDAARQRLNEIVHPRVRELTAKFMATVPADSIVVHDVPLLLENGMELDYHLVCVVTADEPRRLEWLAGRGLSGAHVAARIASQVADERRRQAADVLIENNGSLADLRERVERLWQLRILPFQENLKAQQAAIVPTEILQYDEAWPWRYRRLESRLEDTLGRYADQIEHVGATAVPGTQATGVIDIRLWAKGVELEQLAVPLGEWGWFPMGVAWRVPRFGYADPENPARLFVHTEVR